MAKDDIGGVWRTISGRRVFIKDGQDLATAMRESGKFNNIGGNKKKFSKREALKKDIAHQVTEAEKNGNWAHAEAGKRELKRLNEEENNKSIKELNGEMLGDKYKGKGETPSLVYSNGRRIDIANNADGGKTATIWKDGKIERKTNLPDNVKGDKTKEYFDNYLEKLDNQKENEEEKLSKLTQRDVDDLITELNREGSDFSFSEVRIENDKVKAEVGVFMPDERGYVTREIEIPVSKDDDYDDIKTKLRMWQDEHDSPDTFYDDDFKTEESDLDKVKRIQKELKSKDNLTSSEKEWLKQLSDTQSRLENGQSREEIIKQRQKEIDEWEEKQQRNENATYEQYNKDVEKANNFMKSVLSKNAGKKTGNDYLPKAKKVETAGTSNRKEVSDNIQAHILDYYDNPVDFMEQMDAMDWLPTRWHAGQKLAEGGSYLIYNGDMADFLDSLNINPKGKKFSEDKSFQMYTSLIGRESERLYNRLEKLFDQYKKEHKNSNATLEDFRKWFK